MARSWDCLPLGSIQRSFHLAPFLLLAVLIGAERADASHFRYGHLSWKPRPDVSTSTVEFTLTNAFRRCGYSGTGPDGCPIVGDVISENIGGTGLSTGDGTSIGSPLQYRVTAFDVTGDWVIGIALDPATQTDRILHTYPSPNNDGSPWLAAIDSCCRIGNLVNASDDSYRVETPVDLSSGNGSPVSSLPPIVACPQNSNCAFTIPSADSDPNTTLAWRLAEPQEDGGITQPGPPYVAGALSINAATGLVTWDTTGAALGSLWATQSIIEDRDASSGSLRTKVGVDHLILIVASGDPPVITPPPNTPPICGATIPTFVGDTVQFVVSASDATPADLVTLNTTGLPTGASMDPPLPVAGNPVESEFSWSPTSDDVGVHIINFIAADSGGLQTLCPVTVEVEEGPGILFTGVYGGGLAEIRDDPNRIITTFTDNDIPLVVAASGAACAGASCVPTNDDDLAAIAQTDAGGITSLGFFATSVTSHATLNTPGNTTTLTTDLSSNYKPGTRVFLAGHSDGGGDVQDVLEKLDKLGIPVEASAHIDSIEIGNDASIPDNTKVAMGYFQKQGLFLTRGENKLKAKDKTASTVTNTEVRDAAGPANPNTDSNAYHRNMDNDSRTWTPLLASMRAPGLTTSTAALSVCQSCEGTTTQLVERLGSRISASEKREVRSELARQLSDAKDIGFILDVIAESPEANRDQLLDVLAHVDASGLETRIERAAQRATDIALAVALVYSLKEARTPEARQAMVRILDHNSLPPDDRRQLANAMYLAFSQSVEPSIDSAWMLGWARNTDLSIAQTQALARIAARFPHEPKMKKTLGALARQTADPPTQKLIRELNGATLKR